mgnify:CR=1 FL=1
MPRLGWIRSAGGWWRVSLYSPDVMLGERTAEHVSTKFEIYDVSVWAGIFMSKHVPSCNSDALCKELTGFLYMACNEIMLLPLASQVLHYNYSQGKQRANLADQQCHCHPCVHAQAWGGNLTGGRRFLCSRTSTIHRYITCR